MIVFVQVDKILSIGEGVEGASGKVTSLRLNSASSSTLQPK